MYTDIKDIPQIVHSLRSTFQKGTTKSIEYRKQQLYALQRLLTEQREEIARVIKADLNKHEVETVIAEIAPVAGEIDYMLSNMDKLAKTQSVKPFYMMNSTTKCTIRKEPKGVVLVIGAWNYPIHLLLLPMVGAIATGNTVIVKPSEVSSHTAEFVGKYLPQYLDPQSYAVVQGGVEETTVLLEQQFDHIFYTGNGTVGKIVMAAASKHLTPVTLELGGKSPVIIAPDANLKTAAQRIMWAKLFNAGQICVAPDYVLISKNQVSEFIKHCKNSIVHSYGTEPQKSDSYCRIISDRRFDALKRLLDSVDPSQIVAGGQTDREDRYIAPTIVGPIEPQGNALMDEEIFGPILPIIAVEDLDEAIRIVNSKDHPLALYIFTAEKSTREKIMNQTQSGGVVVNDLLIHVQEISVPFGGVGPSGMGNYHGKRSFDTFTHERSTIIQSPGFESIMSARYPPYNDSKMSLFSLLTLGLPEGFSNKIKSLLGAVGSAKNILLSKPKQPELIEQSKL